ncbi:MAG: amidohydrolase family protein [Bradyrhizobiaceae bacterium]|nr:amidohydrolase family protein [Bradyrhizobiaceae bacterium]
MKIGRFVVDTHVHAQRHAAGDRLRQRAATDNQNDARYTDLSHEMRHLIAYDNSPRLKFDMETYGVDMCVLLPSFGMTNEINLEIVRNDPDKFVAVCNAKKTVDKALAGEEPWSIEAACAELDGYLSTGNFIGIGEGCPGNPTRKTTIGQTERMDEIRVAMQLARKHKVPMQFHTGVVMGYPLTHCYWPETLNPMWLIDIATEFPDVPMVLNHGGMQGWHSKKWVEDCLFLAAASDNVYLETGLWWTELYERALVDPNIGPEKLMWGTDWGASLPIHGQLRHEPQTYAVQYRRQGVVSHQVDMWGWSLKQLWRLDIPQDDLNLILGGTAARVYKLPVPHTRLFKPVNPKLVPQMEK